MARWQLIGAALATASFMATGASAHERPKILTQFGESAQADRTSGVVVTATKGVHLYEGRRPLLGAGPASTNMAASYEHGIEIEITQPWRRIRSMRTQGFYSGKGQPSRRFTQGFYSGR